MVIAKRALFLTARDAQAFTIFAVLIIIIAATTSTIYLATIAPIETERCEFQHTGEVREDFIRLASTISYLIPVRSQGASASVAIKMLPTRDSVITLPLSAGSLSVSPAEGVITVGLREPGTSTSDIWHDEYFNNVTSDGGVRVDTGIGRIILLGPPYSSGYVFSDFLNATGHIGRTASCNSTIYDTMSWNASIPANTEIIIRVRSDMFPNMTRAKDWSVCPKFTSDDGANTIALANVSSVSNGHRYIQYRADLRTWDPNIFPRLDNVSITSRSPPGPVTLAESSGTITFMSNYNHHQNLDISYQNGAVIQWQEVSGGFMVNTEQLESNFVFSSISNRTIVNVFLVNLTGNNVTVSGAPAAYVRLYRLEHEKIANPFFYPDLTINISTEYYSIWTDWFTKTIAESGLNAAAYNISSNETAHNVQITLFGGEEGVEVYLDTITVITNVQA